MIPHPHRQKGSGPQLGAKGPQQCGPFGPYGADEDHLDDGGGLDDEDDQERDDEETPR